jgi:hypothetical protein
MRRREGLPFVSPLFTQVRRTVILGSSYPVCCITPPLQAP